MNRGTVEAGKSVEECQRLLFKKVCGCTTKAGWYYFLRSIGAKALPPFRPHAMKTAPESAAISSSKNELVVIKLWEIYLLYHPANLYKTLTENSLDLAPEQDLKLPGRIIFRFNASAWEAEIKPLLYQYRIPVTVQSSRLSAVKSKGRIPALR
jgi:hypothetical protein